MTGWRPVRRRSLSRALRHWVTAGVTEAALRAAPHLSAATIDWLGRVLAYAGWRFPFTARQVAANMRALGVYSPEVHRDYFVQLGLHFAGALHALRGPTAAATCGDDPGSADLAARAAARVVLDDSITRIRAQSASGPGAIIVAPHIADYLLHLAALNQVLPLTVYLRYSKDPRRRAAKRRWYQASGVRWISEPARGGGSLGRLGRMATALAEGRVLFITPDLPQKHGQGTPVRFFDREICLPAGPAWLALRTGAPLFVLLAQPAATSAERRATTACKPVSQVQLVVYGPFQDAGPTRGRAARQSAVAQRMQWFAGHLERFLRAHPALWYLWGDKRWTHVLRGDPRYRPLTSGVAAAVSCAALPAGAH